MLAMTVNRAMPALRSMLESVKVSQNGAWIGERLRLDTQHLHRYKPGRWNPEVYNREKGDPTNRLRYRWFVAYALYEVNENMFSRRL